MWLTAGQFSVFSWNILAPQFAPPSKYPWASNDALDWRHRQPRIVRQIKDAGADIVCLQEVEVDRWDGLHAALQREGYRGVLQEVKRDHPMTNAVLLKDGRLEFCETESRSRALITVLRACDGTGADASSPPLYLANVHLEAGSDKAATRTSQLRSLLKRIERRAADAPGAAGAASSVPLVVCGDFNCERSSELHRLLSSAPARTPRAAGGELSSALLPLRDAYLRTPPPWGPPLRSSYRNGRLLDFIFTSDAVPLLRTMPVAELCGSATAHRLPSLQHPSDHLPVGALLSWAGAPRRARGKSGRVPAWQQLYVEKVMQQPTRPRQ